MSIEPQRFLPEPPAPRVRRFPLGSAAPASTRPRAEARNRADWRHAVGRFVVIWFAAYWAARPWGSVAASCGQATLVAALWIPIFQWTQQTFRALTFALGAALQSATVLAIGIVSLSALGFWVPSIAFGRRELATIGLVTLAALWLWEDIVRRVTRSPLQVLVVGGGAQTDRLMTDVARERNPRVEIISILEDATNLATTVRTIEPDLVVVAVARGRPEVFEQLLSVADAGFSMVGLPELYEFAFGRLPVQDLTSAWFMSVLHAYNRPVNRFGKRCFDVVVALTGMLVALPLLLPIVAIVKSTRGPLLYRQTRLGEHGRNFTMLKFRSMVIDAEADGAAQWAARKDSRIIPGGRLLRRVRFDELPQLWNVLRGEMSIVGPRPERPEFIEHLEAEVPFWSQRQLLKPGITGWAQIRSGYASDALGAAEKLSYDLWYLRHRSVALDAIICAQTIPRMLTAYGSR